MYLAYLQETDTAGPIRDTSECEEIGNTFLSNVHFVDGMFYIALASEHDEVLTVDNSIDPVLSELRKDLVRKACGMSIFNPLFPSAAAKIKAVRPVLPNGGTSQARVVV
ncbi:unnamed protein product [Diplocarpon coronariae]|nr:GTP-dependent nucleic acid-binding protein engD [Diplocarpon mali]